MEDKFRLYCPKCGAKVVDVDYKMKSIIEVKCKHCNRMVVYNPQNGKKKVKDIPERKTSSGCRFY